MYWFANDVTCVTIRDCMGEVDRRAEEEPTVDELTVAIAEAIRTACADDAECVAQRYRCTDTHPVHVSVSSNGRIVAVDADVDALAMLAARVLRERGRT